MIEIKRGIYSVRVYDESEKRGIIFPTSSLTQNTDFFMEVQKNKKPCLSVLMFDKNYVLNYPPIEQFLEGRDIEVLKEDYEAKKLYQFYFKRAIPTIIKGEIVNYIFP